MMIFGQKKDISLFFHTFEKMMKKVYKSVNILSKQRKSFILKSE